VLDVGCGTGSMLIHAREQGHVGRLAGIDPDPSMLDRARSRADVEWVLGFAADAVWDREFDLATMTGNAFQCLISDDDVRASLAAVRTALRDGGRFAFETRNVLARGWEAWNPSNGGEFTAPGGRTLRSWLEVESVVGDVVALSETTTEPDGTVLRVDRCSLRFWDSGTLTGHLADADFEVEAQYGDFAGGPVADASAVIVTVARRV
jgi:SAM-dependent methyltransferase